MKSFQNVTYKKQQSFFVLLLYIKIFLKAIWKFLLIYLLIRCPKQNQLINKLMSFEWLKLISLWV